MRAPKAYDIFTIVGFPPSVLGASWASYLLRDRAAALREAAH